MCGLLIYIPLSYYFFIRLNVHALYFSINRMEVLSDDDSLSMIIPSLWFNVFAKSSILVIVTSSEIRDKISVHIRTQCCGTLLEASKCLQMNTNKRDFSIS